MADQSLRFPKGIVKDVMVRIQDKYIRVDFLVLDMQEDNKSPILLGRPFLYTANAIIYIGSGHIHFNLPTEKLRCQFRTHLNHEQNRSQRNRRRRQAHRQAAQPHRGWEEFLGKIVKYEDCYKEQEAVQAPRWSEWEAKAERMDQIAKAEKDEIQAQVEEWMKRDEESREAYKEELELEKKEAEETEMRWKEKGEAPATPPQNGELTEVTSDDEPTE
jgi:hypothetical protein